jgi:hypothetical protein
MRLLFAALTALVAVSSVAAAEPPATAADPVALTRGSLDPTTYDFAQARFAPGKTVLFLAQKGQAEALVAKAHAQPTLAALKAAHVCLNPAEAMTLAGYESALLAKDAAEWSAQKAAADAAFAAYEYARDAVLAGEPAPSPDFEAQAAAMKSVAFGATPEGRELLLRKVRGQLWRQALVFTAPKAYAPGVGLVGAVWLDARLRLDGCAVDADNQAWLRALLDKIVWFDAKTYGPELDKTAWLIAYQADNDRALQTLVLDRTGPLVLQRGSDPRNFAELWDKVALGSGRPQRYGTQMRCVGKVWAPIQPLEEPVKLNERRGWVGLGPIADYARAGAKACGG